MLNHLRHVIEQTADIIVISDVHGIIEYVNPAFEKITGYSPDDIIGKNLVFFSSDRQSKKFYAHMWSTLLSGKVYRNSLMNKRKDGSIFHAEITITPLVDENADITHFIATARDISDEIRNKVQLTHLVQHDSLTNLPNRNLFLDRLQQAISKAHQHHRLVAVLFLDLDRFKSINDSLGRTAGDQLLQQLSERFKKTIREGDTIARFGGDEFVILLDDFDSDNSLSLIAQKILNSLAIPFEIKGHEIFISASIGISMYPTDSDNPSQLIENADMAMDKAKKSGGNCCEFYTTEINNGVIEKLSIETGLRSALELDQFELHYQPLMDLRNRHIDGAEALLRWHHPKKGMVRPDQFIPVAEESGLIIPIGAWVLKQACIQCKKWHRQGLTDLKISVNLSVRQFRDNNLVNMITEALQVADLKPSYLTLEITESSIMDNAKDTIKNLHLLRNAGIHLSIDDFGTGYSSLAYLKRLPIDTIKIDRSFVQEIDTNSDDRSIVQAIIAMGHSMNINIVAEGVEKIEHLNFLNEQHCDAVQGYLISKPVPADEFSELSMEWQLEKYKNYK